MRYFLDTEFIEDGSMIQLLSIGIVTEDGRELYLQTERAALYHKYPIICIHEWVRKNVVPHFDETFATKQKIRNTVLSFVTQLCAPYEELKQMQAWGGDVEFWADYASYDWIALCQIFGTMMDLPPQFPMYCNDIQQLRRELGSPDLPAQKGIVHHALHDARYCKELWEYLCIISRFNQ